MDTNPISLPLTLDQGQIDLALDNELAKRRQTKAKGIYAYTNGRAPKGLFATHTISEETIRQAVINHVKSFVQPQFQHFSVEFVVTRGDDGGLSAQIVASTHEIEPEEEPKEEPAPTPRRVALRTTAAKPAAEPEVAPTKAEPEPEAAEEVEEASNVAEPQDDEPTDAPWQEDTSEEVEAAEADSDAEGEAEEEAEPAEAASEEAPREPRARLFANLRKPTNEPTE